MESTQPIFELVNKNEKGYIFVGGNTRHLKNLGQAELAILAKNGDTRVRIKSQEKTEVAAAEQSAPVAETKKSAKQNTPAA